MMKAGISKALLEEETFELGVRRLTARTQACRNQGRKRPSGQKGSQGVGLGGPAWAGGRVMSSIRWFPLGALDLEDALFAKTRGGSEAQAWAPPCSWACGDHRPA